MRAVFAAVACLTLLFSARPAAAGDVCDYYRHAAPDIYRLLCTGGGRHASVAGAHSTFVAGFNLNPGALPTEPTTYGLEGIGSYIRDATGRRSPAFAIVKGYHKFGTGISTSGNNTFYGDDLLERLHGPPSLATFDPIEPPQGHIANLNVGTSLELVSFSRSATLALGLSGRYNYTTNTFGGGPALYLQGALMSAGIGVTREKVSNSLPAVDFFTGTVSARLSRFELEYSLLTDSSGLGLSPIHIVTLTGSFGRFMLTAAIRRLNYLQGGTVVQEHYAVQLLLSKTISIGALYNWIPGANSLALQYFL